MSICNLDRFLPDCPPWGLYQFRRMSVASSALPTEHVFRFQYIYHSDRLKKQYLGVVLICISIIMSKVEPFSVTRLFRAFAYFSTEHLVLSHWFLGPPYKLGKLTFDKIWVSNGISHLVIFRLCLHFGIKISLMQFNFSIFFSNLLSILSHNLEDLPYFKIIKGFSHVYF